jgi:hypothetical protein
MLAEEFNIASVASFRLSATPASSLWVTSPRSPFASPSRVLQNSLFGILNALE